MSAQFLYMKKLSNVTLKLELNWPQSLALFREIDRSIKEHRKIKSIKKSFSDLKKYFELWTFPEITANEALEKIRTLKNAIVKTFITFIREVYNIRHLEEAREVIELIQKPDGVGDEISKTLDYLKKKHEAINE